MVVGVYGHGLGRDGLDWIGLGWDGLVIYPHFGALLLCVIYLIRKADGWWVVGGMFDDEEM